MTSGPFPRQLPGAGEHPTFPTSLRKDDEHDVQTHPAVSHR